VLPGSQGPESCGCTAGMWREQVVECHGRSCGVPRNKLWSATEQVVDLLWTQEQDVDSPEEAVDIESTTQSRGNAVHGSALEGGC
jgi:hypothetical protein